MVLGGAAALTALLLSFVPLTPRSSPQRGSCTPSELTQLHMRGEDMQKPMWSGTLFLTLPKGDEAEVALRVSFVEEIGYEPPQGTVDVDACPAFTTGSRTRWILSEDPDDRKDGLWVWGLFKEPLYPFILFELDLEIACDLPGGTAMPAGTYYFQGEHKRSKETGCRIGKGTVSRRVPVQVALPGAEGVSYMETVQVGTFTALQLPQGAERTQ